MADRVNEILLRISGDDDDASKSIEKIIALLEVLDQDDAQTEVNVRGTSEALGELSALSAALRAISGDEANISVDLNTADALGNLAALNTALRATGFDIPVHLNPSDAFLQLARLQREANIQGRIDMDIADDEVQRSLQTLRIAIEKLTVPKHPIKLDVEGLAKTLGDLGIISQAVNRNDTYKLLVTLQDREALNKLAQLRAAEAAIDKNVNINADADTGLASAKMLALAALAAELDHNKVTVDIETDRQGIEGAKQAVSGLLGVFNTVKNAGSSLANTFSGLGVNIGPFTTALNPAMASALLIVIALMAQLVVGVIALGASFAAAVGGVIALATAFLGALAPAVAVVGATVLRLGKVFEVLKSQDAAAQDQAVKSAQGHRAATTAARARADAAENLARAEQALGIAASQAYRDMADAAEKAKDAVLSLARAQLSREQASLNIDKAKLALQQFREELGLTGKDYDNAFKKFSSVRFDYKDLNKVLAKGPKGLRDLTKEQQLDLKQKILDVKDAYQSQKESVDGVKDAQVNLARAQQDYNKYIKDSINANPGYIAALRAREDAAKAVKRANEDASTDAVAASLAKANTQAGKLSATEDKLLKAIKAIRDIWGETFGGATDAVIGGIANVLTDIGTQLKPLRDIFTSVGKAIGGAFENLNQALTPIIVKLMEDFAGAVGSISAPTINAIRAIAIIFRNLATASLPFLVPAFQAVANWLTQIATKSSSVQDLAGFVGFLISNLRDWVDLFKGVGRIIVAAFQPAGTEGQKLVQTLADAANNFADFLGTDEGRQETIDFFKRAVQFTTDFFKAVAIATKFIIILGKVTIDTSNFIVGVFTNVVKGAQEVVGAVRSISHWVDNAYASIVTFISNIPAALRDLKDAMFNAGADLGLAIVKGLVHGVKDLGKDAIKGAGGLANKIIGGIAGKLKIGSPSKVMVEMGKSVVEGLSVGLKGGSAEIGRVATSSLSTPIIRSVKVPAAAGAATSGSKGGVNIENVNLPPAPGHDQMGDARHQAAQFMAELRRRGH